MPVILIVDDEPDILELAEEILEDADFTVRCASNWIEATKAIFKGEIDLVLLDVNMPWMKGDQGLDYLRDTIKGPLPKIIFYSAMNQVELGQLSQKSGVDGYIQKGGDVFQLPQEVEKFLE